MVWSALIINTIVEKGPIIFLKLAQANEGQFDGVVSPSKGFGGMMSFDNSEGIFMNYTRVMEVVDHKYNLAPRKQFCGTRITSDFPGDSIKRYDDVYKNYVEKKYMTTPDGLTKVPDREFVYNFDRRYMYQACIMFFDT